MKVLGDENKGCKTFHGLSWQGPCSGMSQHIVPPGAQITSIIVKASRLARHLVSACKSPAKVTPSWQGPVLGSLPLAFSPLQHQPMDFVFCPCWLTSLIGPRPLCNDPGVPLQRS